MSATKAYVRLGSAMGLRVAASMAYVGLVALISWRSGTESAAQLIYVFAVSYVSSNLGRFGTDQHIAKSAQLFRQSDGQNAARLLSTHLVFSVTTVPVLALIIHFISNAFPNSLASGATSSLSFWAVALSAIGLSLSQTMSAAWQAAGRPTLSVLVFPLACYAMLALANLYWPGTEVAAFSIASITCGIAGLAGLVSTRSMSLVLPRVSLLQGNLSYYVMGLSFYIAVWLPFIYLPGLLSASNVILLNLAVRLASIQSMPSNAISGYLMPQFAVQAENLEYAKIEKTMKQVIIITIVFQLVYLAVLAFTFLFFSTQLGLDIPGLMPVMAILAIGQFVNGATGPVGPALLMVGQQKIMARISFAICIVSAVADYVATKFFGVIGFATSMAAMVALQNILYMWHLYHRAGLNPYRSDPTRRSNGGTSKS